METGRKRERIFKARNPINESFVDFGEGKGNLFKKSMHYTEVNARKHNHINKGSNILH